MYHYHSIYDSQYWMEQYGDAGFHRHVTAAKIRESRDPFVPCHAHRSPTDPFSLVLSLSSKVGLVLLRTADSLVLPLNITQYASELSDYRDKVAHIHSALSFTDDLDLSSLSSAIAKVQKATAKLDLQTADALKKLHELIKPGKRASCHAFAKRAVDAVVGRGGGERKQIHPMPSPGRIKKIKKVLEEIREINGKLAGFEAGFISEDGLPGREVSLAVPLQPMSFFVVGADASMSSFFQLGSGTATKELLP